MPSLRAAHPLQAEVGFAWRATAPNRLESLSDIVFGFALTLLVVSSAPPNSFSELRTALLGFPGFLVAFAMLLLIWHAHYLYFRRYGLEDGWTMALNAVLLFLVLLFVYPLKFIAGLFSSWSSSAIGLSHEGASALTVADAAAALQLFSGFYAAVFGLIALLYARALLAGTRLNLNSNERRATIASLAEHVLHAAVALLSIGLTIVLPQQFKPMAGFVFFLIGPLIGLAYWRLTPPSPAAQEPS